MSEEKKESVADKKISRRSLLKYTAALAAGAVVGVAAEYGATYKPPPPPPPSFKPPLSADVQARVDAIKKQLIDMHTGEDIHYMDCDANGCRGAPCIVKVRTKNGVVTAIENGDPLYPGVTIEDQYIGEDALKKFMIQARPCTRAFLFPKTIYHPDRLLYPMKRVGNLGERKFARISWTEALDTIANQFKSLQEKYGPTFTNTAPRVGSYAGFGTGTWGYTSNSSHTLADLMMFGEIISPIVAHRSPIDCFNIKAFVGFGMNTVINQLGGSHGNPYTYLLKYLKEKGVPIILTDCIYSLGCETLGDQWIPIRAGTDLAMFLAMANVLFKENLYDQAFVSKYVEPTGFAKWKDYVLGNTAGPDGKIDRTPEWAEKICGVPADTIRGLARFCAAPENKPLHWATYWSAGKKRNGEMTGWADECVKVMLGAFGLPGCNGSSGRSYSSFANYLTSPSPDWQRAATTYRAPTAQYSRTRQMVSDLYPKLLAGQITEDQYRATIGCAKTWPLPKPVMYSFGSIHADMNTNQYLRGLKQSAQFIVSRAYHTTYPNVWYADIVLPLADSHLEDITTHGFVTGPNWFILSRKSVEPPGEAKPSVWIDCQIENRFGLLGKSDPRMANVLDDPKKFDDQVNSIYQEAYQTWAARDDIKPLNPPSWADFDKLPIFRVPYVGLTYAKQDQPPFNAYTPFLTDPVKNPLNTPSGKIEYYSSFIADPQMGTKEWIGPQLKNSSGICFGGASPPVIPPMAQFVLEPNGPVSPYAATYPLNVISLHNNYLQHHSQDNNPYRRELARHACWLSVADAKVRGIKDGDLVRVTSEFGEMIIPAYVTPRIVPGSANVGYGGWYEPTSLKTDLMPDGVDGRGMHNFLTPSTQYPWTIGCAPVQNNCQVTKFEMGSITGGS